MNPYAWVIRIEGHASSEAVALRCIESAARFGLHVEPWSAHTPAMGPMELFARNGWAASGFIGNPYSRLLPCMACFLSHAAIWAWAVQVRSPVLVLEHDAVFVRELPNLENEPGLINLGRPSFGKFRTPRCGIGPLVSKPHLPGAHAYYLHHGAAKELLRAAERHAEPTDVFLHVGRFPFIREAYPWPVECHEEFTTIQGPKGCQAKHRAVTISSG